MKHSPHIRTLCILGICIIILFGLIEKRLHTTNTGEILVEDQEGWITREFSLSETGELFSRDAPDDDWSETGIPVSAPKEWSDPIEISSRQDAELLINCPQIYAKMVSPLDGWLIAVYGNGVANADTYVYRSHDGGLTWSETTQIEEASWWPCVVEFLDQDHAIVAIGLFNEAPIFYTSDGGISWEEMELPLPSGKWEAQSLSVNQDQISLTVKDRSKNGGQTVTLFSENQGETWYIQ